MEALVPRTTGAFIAFLEQSETKGQGETGRMTAAAQQRNIEA